MYHISLVVSFLSAAYVTVRPLEKDHPDERLYQQEQIKNKICAHACMPTCLSACGHELTLTTSGMWSNQIFRTNSKSK